MSATNYEQIGRLILGLIVVIAVLPLFLDLLNITEGVPVFLTPNFASEIIEFLAGVFVLIVLLYFISKIFD